MMTRKDKIKNQKDDEQAVSLSDMMKDIINMEE